MVEFINAIVLRNVSNTSMLIRGSIYFESCVDTTLCLTEWGKLSIPGPLVLN